MSGAKRPCRFHCARKNGERCSCPGFEAAPDGEGGLCACGHKASMHRSDVAERSATKFLGDLVAGGTWVEGEEGLVEVKDEVLMANLQMILTESHKETDNWTRDRGCSKHGVNGCTPSCASKNRNSVPIGYKLVKAYRNQNVDLWQKYQLVKTAILEECARQPRLSFANASDQTPYMETQVATTDTADFEEEMDKDCNEWRLFHGTGIEACRGICSTNYRLALAGTGATWKDPGKAQGTPLYGFGIYFAERITKADEYAEAIDAGEENEGLHCVLLNRVCGGRTNVITTNEIDKEKLRKEVFDGPFHSVFGDRVVTLGKPYREIVVYDKDQCYPEFMLMFTRDYVVPVSMDSSHGT